jgi:hypothetical protein
MRLAGIPNPIFIMKNKSYYFSHDYNAANDTKVLFLRHQLGMEGYGIYWFIIERLADAGGKLPLELIPVLAMQMQSTDIKVKGVIMQFDLFRIDEGEFWSERLNDHLGLRAKLSESGKNGALNRWKNGEANGVAIGEANAKKRKEKEIKENINNNIDIYNKFVEESIISFENLLNPFKELIGANYKDFLDYWTEKNDKGKLRYQCEKFFDIKRRINTWNKNTNKYGNSKTFGTSTTSESRMATLKEWVHS